MYSRHHFKDAYHWIAVAEEAYPGDAGVAAVHAALRQHIGSLHDLYVNQRQETLRDLQTHARDEL